MFVIQNILRDVSERFTDPTMKEKLAKIAQQRQDLQRQDLQSIEDVYVKPSEKSPPIPSTCPDNHTFVDTQLQSKFSKLSVSSSRRQGFPRQGDREAAPEFYDTGMEYIEFIIITPLISTNVSEKYYTNKLLRIIPSILIALFNTLVLNLFSGASFKTSAATLDGFQQARRQTLFEVRSTSTGLTNLESSSLDKVTGPPTDIRTVYRIFNLDPELTIYACCPLPACSAIYAPIPGLHDDEGFSYPLRCSQVKFGKSCDTLLVGKACTIINGVSVPRPIKPYPYHHFNDHVASMLSRPGIETALRNHMYKGTLQEEISDIMSSKTLREFRDATGQLFIREAGTELRLVWALCVDWYNPRTNKASGKSVSTGVIAMICLSLPPEIRYLEENVYLCGIIPGPHEPSVDATNHFMEPLMHDLAVSYECGIHYSRTYEYPSGRTSRSAIIPVIADTLASKKVTGHHGHSSHRYFCSRCRLKKDQISNLDPASWDTPLSRSQHEAYAESWRAAPKKSIQDSLLKANGIRWSVLLLLPYWQPSDWSITEGMHVLLLGVIKRHCRDLLGLDIDCLPEEVVEDDPPSPDEIRRAKLVLEQQCTGKLRKLTMRLLKALCKEQGIISKLPTRGPRRKHDYVVALLVGQFLCHIAFFADLASYRAVIQLQ